MSASPKNLDTLAHAECARHWLEKIYNDKSNVYRAGAGIALWFTNLIIRSAREQIAREDLAGRHTITSPGGDA